jgi:hypothetical protein
MKEVFEEGVGSKWVPRGPDDFMEVSWEDALLPPKDEAQPEGNEPSAGETHHPRDPGNRKHSLRATHLSPGCQMSKRAR